MSGQGFCELCRTWMPLAEVTNHLRLMHPEEYGDGFATWPDGEPVILDETLQPDDFRDPSPCWCGHMVDRHTDPHGCLGDGGVCACPAYCNCPGGHAITGEGRTP